MVVSQENGLEEELIVVSQENGLEELIVVVSQENGLEEPTETASQENEQEEPTETASQEEPTETASQENEQEEPTETASQENGQEEPTLTASQKSLLRTCSVMEDLGVNMLNIKERKKYHSKIKILEKRTFTFDKTHCNAELDMMEKLLNYKQTNQYQLDNEDRINICIRRFRVYSISVFIGVVVVTGLVIFVSNLFLTETTGSCNSDMDCYAIDRNNTNIGPLNIKSCYDYLRNVSIHCYSCSFNYVISISKSGSVIVFGNFFLLFEIALLLGSIHLGNKTDKSLRLANYLFWSINIAMLIFYLFSVSGIIYEFTSISTKTMAYQWEIILGYFINLTCTLFVPIIFTCIIFGLFSHQNRIMIKVITTNI